MPLRLPRTSTEYAMTRSGMASNARPITCPRPTKDTAMSAKNVAPTPQTGMIQRLGSAGRQQSDAHAQEAREQHDVGEEREEHNGACEPADRRQLEKQDQEADQEQIQIRAAQRHRVSYFCCSPILLEPRCSYGNGPRAAGPARSRQSRECLRRARRRAPR